MYLINANCLRERRLHEALPTLHCYTVARYSFSAPSAPMDTTHFKVDLAIIASLSVGTDSCRVTGMEPFVNLPHVM